MREGQALTQLVEFTSGFPDGDVAWALLNGSGAQVASGAVTPAANSLSTVITVTAAENAIEAGALTSPRELQWNYTVGGLIQRGKLRYRIEAFLPFGVSEDGVRKKLGLEDHELADDDIDLVSAYIEFRTNVTSDKLSAAVDDVAFAAGNAIEALAARAVLPTLTLRLAQRQSSGTDQFERADPDFESILIQLDRIIALGYAQVNPDFDPTHNFNPLVIPVVRSPDPVTNA